MNNILSMVKSLHSTLYTVWVQVSNWAMLKMVFSSKSFHGQPKVREHFQRGALIAWCFHPGDKETQCNEYRWIQANGSKSRFAGESSSHFGNSQWIRLWLPLRLYFYPSSVGEKEKRVGVKIKKTKTKMKDFWSVLYNKYRANTCLKEDFYVLTGRLLFQDGVRTFTHHVVDGLHDVQHFLLHVAKRQFT